MLIKKYHSIILSLICTGLLAGCESLVHDLDPNKLPGAIPKLVVESYISPQSPVIEVSVSESKPVYGPVDNEYVSIKNAQVVLSNGNNQISLVYHADRDRYTADSAQFKIEAGKRYLLTVTANNKQVTAFSSVPVAKVTLTRYLVDTLLNRDYKGDTAIRIRSYYQDIAGQADFYGHRAFAEYEITVALHDPQSGEVRFERVRRIQRLDIENELNGSTFQNDINLDGMELKAPTFSFQLPFSQQETGTTPGGASMGYSSNPKLIKIWLETLHLDEAYYRLHRTWIGDRDDNPFAEPSLVYSNIEGGLGCFGSYQSGVTTINF